MIGIHATYIWVKVPYLLIASNLRKLGGGSLCGKGAERSGSATIEKWSCRQSNSVINERISARDHSSKQKLRKSRTSVPFKIEKSES